MKRISALTLALSLLLCACAKELQLTFEDDGSLSDGLGNTYYSAPVGYEPTNQGEEYGKIDDAIGETLYQVGTLDPKDYLTGAYSGATTLFFHNADITLPTLWEMEPALCYLCEQETNVITICTIGDGTRSGDAEEDGEILRTLVSRMQNAIEKEESDSIWPRSDVRVTYQLKFYSDKWPAFYYNLPLAVCDGGTYLYDRQSQTCVDIGDLLTPYYEGTAPETTSGSNETGENI